MPYLRRTWRWWTEVRVAVSYAEYDKNGSGVVAMSTKACAAQPDGSAGVDMNACIHSNVDGQ